jgi:hypothetical protein
MTGSELIASVTADGTMGKHTGRRQSPSIEEISQLAYHFYEQRGGGDGHDLDDWLAAEQELLRHYR